MKNSKIIALLATFTAVAFLYSSYSKNDSVHFESKWKKQAAQAEQKVKDAVETLVAQEFALENGTINRVQFIATLKAGYPKIPGMIDHIVASDFKGQTSFHSDDILSAVGQIHQIVHHGFDWLREHTNVNGNVDANKVQVLLKKLYFPANQIVSRSNDILSHSTSHFVEDVLFYVRKNQIGLHSDHEHHFDLHFHHKEQKKPDPLTV